jgi:hypothetical protein
MNKNPPFLALIPTISGMGKISLSPAERMTSYAMRVPLQKDGAGWCPPVMFVYIPHQQCYIMLYLPHAVEFSHKATERYLRGLQAPSCVNVHVIFCVQNQHLFPWYQAATVTFFPLMVWRTLPFEWLRNWDPLGGFWPTRETAEKSEKWDFSPRDWWFRHEKLGI